MESLVYPVAILTVLLDNALPTFAFDYCYMYNSYYLSYYLGYCSDTCCGTYAIERYCCYTYYYPYYYYSASASIGAIVGAVIGGLIGLAIIIAILVCICHACNKHTQRGAVVSTVPIHVNTVSSTVQYQAQPSQQFIHASVYGYPAYAPPAYTQHVTYPVGYAAPPPPNYNPAPPDPPTVESGSPMPPPTYAENIVSSQPPEGTGGQ